MQENKNSSQQVETVSNKEQTSDELIAKARNLYKSWLKLPAILFWVVFSLFIIWGIVDAVAFMYEGRWETYYGIMRLPNGVVSWLIWVLIGSIFAALTFFITQLNMAKEILKVEYLKKISERKVVKKISEK